MKVEPRSTSNSYITLRYKAWKKISVKRKLFKFSEFELFAPPLRNHVGNKHCIIIITDLNLITRW